MSGRSEERSGWRPQRSSSYQNRSVQRPNTARERSANNSPNPAVGQSFMAVGGNNWGNSNRENRGRPPMSPMDEEHVPVKGFNARDTREMLKRGYVDSMNSGARSFKSNGKDGAGVKSGGPWGSKPNAMAGGQDFLLQLRKQLASLQQGGTVPGG